MSVVAAAIIGSAVVGGVAANSASKRGTDAANRATDAATRSADGQVQLGYDELDFAKQQYADAKPWRDAAAQTSQKVSEAQLASLEQNDALAKEYADYNRTTFRPLEQGLVADAQGYDTPERRQQAADAAMADVNAGFSATGAARARTLAAQGINPGSTRAIGAMAGQDVEQAKALAGAAFQARKGVETTGFARKMDAASLGRNLPSNQATAAGLALNAGNSAVGNAVNGINAVQSGAPIMMAGYNGAIGAQANAGSIYSSIARNGLSQSQADAAMWGNLGSVAGIALSRYGGTTNPALSGKWNGTDFSGTSDKNLKTDIEPVSDEEALAATNATPVKKWKYSPAKMAAAGIPMGPEDHGTQVGPMAQDVARTMGAGASDGKRLNLVSMNGLAMKSIQAVDKKVGTLTKQVNKLASLIGEGRIAAGATA